MTAKAQTTDERFDKIDAQFQEMREQFQKQGEQSQKQFKSIDKQFESVNKQLDRIATTVVKGFERNDREHENMASRADMQRVLNLLDAMAKRQEISDEDRLVMGHQLDRVNGWVQDLADKIGYRLSY
jgi:hypothetical protein